jgi:hypothetical protein
LEKHRSLLGTDATFAPSSTSLRDDGKVGVEGKARATRYALAD